MSYIHLTSKDRVELAVLLRTGCKQNSIARILGKDPSTISRELKRNAAPNKTGYDARKAQDKTKERRIKANQRFRRIENDSQLRKYIVKRIKKYWSPEQIAGRLKRKHKKTVVGYVTIYTWIYEKRPDLKEYLRCQKGKYRRRHGTKKREKQREQAQKKRIDLRPKIVEKRKRLGDWEGDIIFGQERKIGILIHVERRSGFALGDKMESLLAPQVRRRAVQRFQRISQNKRHSITYDNDTRFAEYELIERDIETDVYFTHPYHAWERGTNENTNGLLRQFFPKKSSFAKIKQKDVERVIRLLNNRPRKRLDYLTPTEVFRKNCTLD